MPPVHRATFVLALAAGCATGDDGGPRSRGGETSTQDGAAGAGGSEKPPAHGDAAPSGSESGVTPDAAARSDASGRDDSGALTGDAGGAAPLAFAFARVTTENRHAATMSGGWGPHLRGVMRDPMGAVWLAIDSGSDVLVNPSVLYFRRDDAGAWSKVAESAHNATVQQNAGTILVGKMLYTYAVNVAAHWIEECYLDTSDPSYRACNAIPISGATYTTPPSSNYVGAAVLEGGGRIVWFTVVGAAGGSGSFIYTYNYGGGWNGPITTALSANDIGYVHAMATKDGNLEVVGQTFFGAYPAGTYAAEVARIAPGNAVSFVALKPAMAGAAVHSTADLFVDHDSGAVHVLTYESGGKAAYYFRPEAASWSAHVDPVHVFDDGYRACFSRPDGGPLHIVLGSATSNGITVLRAVDDGASDAIDWSKAERFAVALPEADLDAPAAIYTESRTYQDGPVGTLSFAWVGNQAKRDGEIWFAIAR
jgi:hypothetical protein